MIILWKNKTHILHLVLMWLLNCLNFTISKNHLINNQWNTIVIAKLRETARTCSFGKSATDRALWPQQVLAENFKRLVYLGDEEKHKNTTQIAGWACSYIWWGYRVSSINGTWNNLAEWKFKTAQFNFCKRVGHIKSNCFALSNQEQDNSSKQQNMIETSGHTGLEVYYLFTLKKHHTERITSDVLRTYTGQHIHVGRFNWNQWSTKDSVTDGCTRWWSKLVMQKLNTLGQTRLVQHYQMWPNINWWFVKEIQYRLWSRCQFTNKRRVSKDSCLIEYKTIVFQS